MVIKCEVCGGHYEVEEGDIVLGGFPHVECPDCGNMIPVF